MSASATAITAAAALYSFGRTPARHQREDRGQHRRQAVAEQDEIDEAPADRLAGKQRILDHAEPEHDGASVSAAITSAPTSWTTLSVRTRSRSSPMVMASPTQTCSAISARLEASR